MSQIFIIFYFSEKARLIENQGARGGIVIDSNQGTTATGNPLFAMSGDGTDDVRLTSFDIVYSVCVMFYTRVNCIYCVLLRNEEDEEAFKTL